MYTPSKLPDIPNTTKIKDFTGRLKYICELCGKEMINKNDMRRHSRTHTGEKPYQCSTCGKCFAQKAHLELHVKSTNSHK